MRNLRILVLVLFVSSLSCKQSKQTETAEKETAKEQIEQPVEIESTKIDTVEISEEESTDDKTVIIKEKTAVFIWPDSKWIEKKQEEYTEDQWNEVVADNLYYNDLAETYLKENGIPVKGLFEKEYIIFHKDNGEIMEIMIDSIDDGFVCLLFNPDRNPIKFTDMDIEEEFEKAFK